MSNVYAWAKSDIVWVGNEGPKPPLSLHCQPAVIQRASTPTSCAPNIPPGSTLELTNWKFVGGPNNEFIVTHTSTPPTTWDGLIVTSGTVWVYGNVDGTPDSASTQITVTPRAWPNPVMDTPLDVPQSEIDPEHMPVIPVADHGLGHAHTVLDLDNYGPQSLAAVLSGPNYLLFYVAAPPASRIKAWTEINRDALTNSTNEWYQNQATGVEYNSQGQKLCRQSDLSGPILDKIIVHEAAHQTFSRNWYEQNNQNQILEAVISDEGIQALYDKTMDIVTAQTEILDVTNAAAVDPVQFGRVFRF